MPKFSQDAFNQFVVSNEVIGFFDKPIRLSSGRDSHFYVNWRNLTSDAYLMDQLTDHLLMYLQDHQMVPHSIYGVPEGATKTGLIASWLENQPPLITKIKPIPMGSFFG